MKPAIFRSVRFNIFLLCVIVLASALGTLLPQIPETPEKVDLFLRAHSFWGRFFQSAGFFNVYQSRWFIALLGLMAFDIIVCKLGKTPPDAGLVSLPPEMQRNAVEEKLDTMEAAIRQKPMIADLAVSAPPVVVMENARAFAGGAAAWLAGMVLLFYMHRRRLWILVGPMEGGKASRIQIGAWSSRGVAGFQKEFDGMIAQLMDALAEATGAAAIVIDASSLRTKEAMGAKP